MKKIRILIVGYGNVGRGVRFAIANNPDLELAGIASRSVERVKKELPDIPVVSVNDPDAFMALRPDVAILCGGSKDDLSQQTPRMVQYLPTVDSFDNHSRLPEYYHLVDEAAKRAGHVSLISIGWDPGIFSLERVLAGAFLPGSRAYGFYGLTSRGGLSMGHSDALRTIPGVKDARQYTHAIPEAIDRIRKGEHPEFAPGDMHTRECFIVPEEGADLAAIEKIVRAMPGYFAPYRTSITFVSQEELNAKCKGFPHDGCVVASAMTGNGNAATVEYRCAWGSNPEATGNVLAAHARAAARLAAEGRKGAFTILDIPATYLTPLDKETLLQNFM